jgi:2-polyprenyl-6-methoxyphenol hydroxylase-like FAD-dependent oxidoreductase
MAAQNDAAIVVIGAGPCGLMCAIELGRRGVPTLVLDEKTSPAPFPQANATQARTMEHYRRLGFAERIRSQGLPPDYPTDIAYFTRFTTHELARFQLPTARSARELVKTLTGSWSAAELPHRCSQMFIERILRAEAEALPTVTIRFGWRAVGVRDTGESVSVEVESVEGRKTLRAGFVVAADGARSFVRKTLGYGFLGEGGAVRDFMGGRMFAIYFRSGRLYDVIPHPRAWSYWTVNRDRRSMMFAINGRDEFVFHTQLRANEIEDQVTDARAKAMFQAALGAPLDVEIVARSSWTAGYALVAEKFRSGRIFLGGDAVHLFTPTGGLGYNTAVEDAVNLGWKLAAVVNGWGGPALLASYESERQAVAKRNTAHARAFADSVGGFVAPAELEEESARGEAARQAAGAYLNAHARAEFNIPGITFGGRYDGSPVIVPDGTAPPPDTVNSYVPTACPGGRAPHMWLSDGRSLFDLFAFELTLLRLGRKTPAADSLTSAAAQLPIPLSVVAIDSEEARDLYGADLVLIRPDQVVAWRGNVCADPAFILRRVTGREL